MVDIRPLDAMDRAFLEEMLFEAFFWDPAWPRPTLAEFREDPEFTKLLADWGAGTGRSQLIRGVSVTEQAAGIMDTITTRPACAADVGWLTEVFLCSLREAITAARGAWDQARERAQFREQLDLASTRIIQLHGADIGFLMSSDHGDDVELHTLCIAPEYQSRGIGSYITRSLVSDARVSGRGVVLSVLKVNERARRLYERLGFVIVNESLHHHRMQLR